MQFRWVAIITLWTLLIGPIVGTPVQDGAKAHTPAAKAIRPLPSAAPLRR
jgi:hypothetical protein